MMNDSVEQWECHDGVGFMKTIGVTCADRVVDFGCRVGHYTIPAALAVGPSGLVYALDKDRVSLEEIKRKATELGLRNIRTITVSDLLEMGIDDGSVDVVLLYDVLHYFTRSQRRKLIRQMFRILKPSGLLSVYPKHTLDDWPSQEFKNLRVSDVVREIQACCFQPDGQVETTLSHDDGLESGCVVNFRKH
jgi:ubiquinone/menaquinone biosynthesis C-methylase UbiE